jgi:hypothetical protein
MAEPYRTDFNVLFSEASKKLDGSAKTILTNQIFAALKCAPVDFLKALSQESEDIQNAVLNVLSTNARNCATGRVLLDVLSATETAQALSQKESALLNEIQACLADTPPFPIAPGPDPEELAERQAKMDTQNTASSEQTPTEALPQETQPNVTDPISTEMSPSSIDWWILLSVALAALAAGFFLGRRQQKR